MMNDREERLMRAVAQQHASLVRYVLIDITATILGKDPEAIMARMSPAEWDEKLEESERFLTELAHAGDAWTMYSMPGTSGLGRLNLHAVRGATTLVLEWQPTDNSPEAIKTRFADLFSSNLDMALPQQPTPVEHSDHGFVAKAKAWFKR